MCINKIWVMNIKNAYEITCAQNNYVTLKINNLK